MEQHLHVYVKNNFYTIQNINIASADLAMHEIGFGNVAVAELELKVIAAIFHPYLILL